MVNLNIGTLAQISCILRTTFHIQVNAINPSIAVSRLRLSLSTYICGHHKIIRTKSLSIHSFVHSLRLQFWLIHRKR